jgi:hypothetical protein
MTSPTVISTMGATVPYITLAELKHSPIQNQLQKLVPGSSDVDRDAELGRIILRVSAMINGECNQNLAATTDVEAGWATVSDFGELRLHTRSSPIISVSSILVGSDPYNLRPVTDLSRLALDPWRITVPAQALSGVAGGGPQLSLSSWRPGRQVWAEWTYVNGYPVTTLTGAVAAGATSVTVGNATGILPNQTQLTIEDGKWVETVVPTAVNGNTLTVPPLLFKHSAGIGVHALPPDVKEVTLLLISRLHDTWSLSMGAIGHGGAKVPGAKVTRAMCDAAVMLASYKRRW